MDRNTILTRLDQPDVLPELPDKFQSLFSTLVREDADTFEMLSEEIRCCEGLESYVLTFINSGFSSVRRKVDTIKDAVSYMGLQTAKTMIFAYVIRLLLSGAPKPTNHFKQSQYWSHILGTSVAAEMLYEKNHAQDKHRLFIYGLVHDVGISVMNRCLPDLMENIVELQLRRNLHQIIAERQIMGGLTHADIGAWICERWRLPSDITHMVSYHHKPLTARECTDELKHLHVADLISTNYYERLMGLRHTDFYPQELLRQIGITMEEVERIGVELPERVNAMRARMDFAAFFGADAERS